MANFFLLSKVCDVGVCWHCITLVLFLSHVVRLRSLWLTIVWLHNGFILEPWAIRGLRWVRTLASPTTVAFLAANFRVDVFGWPLGLRVLVRGLIHGSTCHSFRRLIWGSRLLRVFAKLLRKAPPALVWLTHFVGWICLCFSTLTQQTGLWGFLLWGQGSVFYVLSYFTILLAIRDYVTRLAFKFMLGVWMTIYVSFLYLFFRFLALGELGWPGLIVYDLVSQRACLPGVLLVALRRRCFKHTWVEIVTILALRRGNWNYLNGKSLWKNCPFYLISTIEWFSSLTPVNFNKLSYSPLLNAKIYNYSNQ